MVDIKSATAEIRRGKKIEEERKNDTSKNIMSTSAMQGGHNESKHSEMDPVRQNPIQRTVSSVHMCVQFTVCKAQLLINCNKTATEYGPFVTNNSK